MQATRHVAVPVLSAVVLLLVLAGCGGSTNNPTPHGPFTNASINGTYAVSFSGGDTAGFFAAAGSIQVDGTGNITAGTLDVNRVGANGVPQPVNGPVTGTYAVRPDGRGAATLNSSAGNFGLAFVIISTQHTLVTVFEGSAVGSGSMDLQNAGAFSTAALAGTFAFNLSGVDAAGNPLATVGSVTTDTTGAVTGGVEDTADNGVISQNLAITGGSLTVAGNGRAILNVSTASGTTTFAAYVVDTNHLKLVQTDTASGDQLAGDAFSQPATLSDASLSGPFAFTAAGANISLGPSTVGGVFTADGAGGITGGTEDFNDAGSVVTDDPVLTTSSYSITGVRGTLTLQSGQTTVNFVIYPTTSGVQLLEIDNGFVLSGGAFQQTGTFSNTSISGTYGQNFTAAAGAEVDSVASLTADGAGHLTGIIDINNGGSLSTGTLLNGTYTVGSDGRGPYNISTGIGPQGMAVYVVNGNRALFIEVDANAVAVGEIQHQQ